MYHRERISKRVDVIVRVFKFFVMNGGSTVFNFTVIITYFTMHIGFKTIGDKNSVAYEFYLYFFAVSNKVLRH